MGDTETGVETLKHGSHTDDPEIFVCDVVTLIAEFGLFGEKDESPGAVVHMQERSPLLPITKNFQLVVQCTVQTKNVDHQVKAHTRGIPEQSAIPQNDR